jgi:hypothetical protein
VIFFPLHVKITITLGDKADISCSFASIGASFYLNSALLSSYKPASP